MTPLAVVDVTPAASALTNIPAGMLIWLCLGAGAAITVLLVGLLAAAKAAGRWWRGGRERFERARRHAAIDQAARTPVTRPMSLAEQDAIHGPKLGEVVSQDRIITEQWRAAFGEMTDALTPRMVAPARADLAAIDAAEVIPLSWNGLGDVDPDPGLHELRCRECLGYCGGTCWERHR